MAIIKKPRKRQIDITGPEGNAYSLLGTAQQFAKQLGKDGDKILEEMQAGDYENLIAVFDREFGSVVDLVR